MNHKSFTYPEREHEFTLDGVEYLVIATVVETMQPTKFAFSDPPQVFPALPASDPMVGYEIKPLSGEQLQEWISKYGEQVARKLAEIVNDDWASHQEANMYR